MNRKFKITVILVSLFGILCVIIPLGYYSLLEYGPTLTVKGKILSYGAAESGRTINYEYIVNGKVYNGGSYIECSKIFVIGEKCRVKYYEPYPEISDLIQDCK